MPLKLASYPSHIKFEYCSTRQEAVRLANRAFDRANGEIMTWLGPNVILCPWTCELVVHLFSKCPQVDWLTGGVPLLWSGSRFLVPDSLADGFSRASFFQGRNVATSPTYRHPILGENTFWRQTLWKRSQAQIHHVLPHAGDFELWTHFWEHADLYTVALPLGGRNARVKSDAAYWRAAADILQAHPGATPIPRWKQQLYSIASRLVPRLKSRFGSRASFVRLRARGDECVCDTRYIV